MELTHTSFSSLLCSSFFIYLYLYLYFYLYLFLYSSIPPSPATGFIGYGMIAFSWVNIYLGFEKLRRDYNIAFYLKGDDFGNLDAWAQSAPAIAIRAAEVVPFTMWACFLVFRFWISCCTKKLTFDDILDFPVRTLRSLSLASGSFKERKERWKKKRMRDRGGAKGAQERRNQAHAHRRTLSMASRTSSAGSQGEDSFKVMKMDRHKLQSAPGKVKRGLTGFQGKGAVALKAIKAVASDPAASSDRGSAAYRRQSTKSIEALVIRQPGMPGAPALPGKPSTPRVPNALKRMSNKRKKEKQKKTTKEMKGKGGRGGGSKGGEGGDDDKDGTRAQPSPLTALDLPRTRTGTVTRK